MATIQKYKNTFILQYYLDGKIIRKAFPKGASEKVMQAAKAKVESDVALHKLKLKKFKENSASFGKIMTWQPEILCQIIDAEMLIKDISYKYIDQFKNCEKSS